MDPMAESEGIAWDSSLERVDVACRAVLLLYRRGKWQFLTQLGLRRWECEPGFEYAVDTMEGVRTDRQIAMLLRICPWIFGASIELLRMYQVKTAQSRAAYARKAEAA